MTFATLGANAATPDLQSPYLAVGFDRHAPEFSFVQPGLNNSFSA